MAYAILLGAAVSNDPAYNGFDRRTWWRRTSITTSPRRRSRRRRTENILDRGVQVELVRRADWLGPRNPRRSRRPSLHPPDDDRTSTLIADGTRVEPCSPTSAPAPPTSPIPSSTTRPPRRSPRCRRPSPGHIGLEGKILASVEGRLAGTWKLEARTHLSFYSGKLYRLVDHRPLHRRAARAVGGIVARRPRGWPRPSRAARASFTVKLDMAPTADVVIPVASGNAAEGRASVSNLTSTPPTGAPPRRSPSQASTTSAETATWPTPSCWAPRRCADPDNLPRPRPDISATNRDDDFANTTFPKAANLSIPDQGKRTSVLT